MGRIERREYLAFRRLSSRARVVLDDHPRYLDASSCAPDRSRPAGWGVPESHRDVTAGYWRWDAAESAAAWPEDIAGPELLRVSSAPSPGSLFLRGLARQPGRGVLGVLAQPARRLRIIPPFLSTVLGTLRHARAERSRWDPSRLDNTGN
jgi:hypothetical protein